MSNTFAGQSVYKDLEAAEEKIEQLQTDKRDIEDAHWSDVNDLKATIEQLQADVQYQKNLVADLAEQREQLQAALRQHHSKTLAPPEEIDV